MDHPDYDELYKIVLIGDSGVGKTNLLNQFINDDDKVSRFEVNQRPTIGVEFGSRIIVHQNGTRIRAQIWDTAGQERYRSITSSHYKRAAGAMLVYDVSNPKSLESLKSYWSVEVKKASEPESTLSECLMLVGNKDDLENKVKIPQHDEAARSMNISLKSLTSAKLNRNVSEAFAKLIIAIYEADKKTSGQRIQAFRLGEKDPNSECASCNKDCCKI